MGNDMGCSLSQEWSNIHDGRDLVFTQQCCWRLKCSGMWHSFWATDCWQFEGSELIISTACSWLGMLRHSACPMQLYIPEDLRLYPWWQLFRLAQHIPDRCEHSRTGGTDCGKTSHSSMLIKKGKWLLISCCENRSLISTVTEFFDLCQGVLGIVLKNDTSVQ